MRKQPAPNRVSDAGFTLIDVMVSAAVMTVVTAVFATSILAMYRAANAVDAKSVGQTQLGLVLQRLDREVRYAKGIATTPAAGAATVDFLGVQNTCFQLRVEAGVLAQRSWAYGQNPPQPTAWQTLASGVVTSTPFTYLAPTDRLGYQQLALTLKSGTDAEQAVFTALNTSRTSGNDYCAAGRSLL
ncbi:type II secretion system protein J [Actinoplanes sp. N902-109]|uniref:PulJ/GspJ family protein n=1 Tax=Actinoplanes sp. (strain N902-109) TaxID=649831 RepID=UPI00032961EB|nr:hypothetical protein [Actinoplanes sp. N902-109]AGL21584.1 hypothetical protein L083_8074 [Actinoplanes sp. N902-109]